MRYVLKKLYPITAVKKTEVAMEVDCHLGLHQIQMLLGKITCHFFPL